MLFTICFVRSETAELRALQSLLNLPPVRCSPTCITPTLFALHHWSLTFEVVLQVPRVQIGLKVMITMITPILASSTLSFMQQQLRFKIEIKENRRVKAREKERGNPRDKARAKLDSLRCLARLAPLLVSTGSLVLTAPFMVTRARMTTAIFLESVASQLLISALSLA